ncbi:MAG: hypothetical protein QOF78_4273 [Phycisphaerales bacterium]|jgi:hypothetical protein|nr:hypothetical protein [Phycisphaerales bacterium]
MKLAIAALLMLASPMFAAEKSVAFVPAKPDPLVGDWKGESGGVVAQVFLLPDGNYRANLLTAFDAPEKPLAVLRGTRSNDAVTFTGDGWTATITQSRFAGSKGSEQFNLRHVTRTSPTLGAPPPEGAFVLFDGKHLDAWAKKAGKEWLKEDGPAQWKLIDGGAVEVVPGTDCIITHAKFGDCHLHLEFRILGSPTNSGVFLQTRYEVNINDSYGRIDGSSNGGLDNCTEKIRPRVQATLPPLAWQTFDIDFRAPRVDAAGKKTESARATVLLNGVKIYDNQELDSPHGAAGRLGEAPTGPLMLQEHGEPVQFRNLWLVEKKPAR